MIAGCRATVLPGPARRPQGCFQAERLGGALDPAVLAVGRFPADAAADLFQVRLVQRLIDMGQPVHRPRDRPGVKQRPGIGLDEARSAGPPPVFRPSRQIGPDGIAFDVAEDDQQMLVLLRRPGRPGSNYAP
jgi:hypothetical protein